MFHAEEKLLLDCSCSSVGAQLRLCTPQSEAREREKSVCVRVLNILEISPEESGGVVAVHF